MMLMSIALMQMHKQNPDAAFDAVALAVSERARARSLLELLAEARADIRQGVDSSLLEREHSLRQRLNARAAAQVRLLSGEHTTEQADAAAKEIASITTEYEELRAQIRASSPRYGALTQPQPLNLAEIQQQALDPDTLLLEYSLGDNASYLFVVNQTSIASYQLPKRAEIEAATRRVRELLTAPQPRPGETGAKRQARMHEIFNLRLPAELVVLSACQTGLGKELKGEGLVGLTRGFMYAGAARVMASLWEVNDVSTAELMKRFYRRMLQDGMRPAAALRAAQIEMWKSPQWQSEKLRLRMVHRPTTSAMS
jgi:CHAT domain-containing protein